MKRNLSLPVILLIVGVLLSACQPAANDPEAGPAGSASIDSPVSAPGAAATAAPNDVTGPGGGSVVRASDGVVLLTPGAPLPTPDLSDLIAELHAYAAADLESNPIEGGNEPVTQPAGPVDISELQLPEGISLYPDASDFQTSPQGESMQYVIFYTVADPETVIENYAQQAEQGKYMNISLDLPNARGEFDGSWMKDGMILTITAYPGDRTKVMIAWMGL